MRVYKVTFAALLALAAAAAYAQRPVRYDPNDDKNVPLDYYISRLGTLKGTISGAEDIPGVEWLIVLEGEVVKDWKFFSNPDGTFEGKVPAGVYKVQVKALPGEAQRAQRAGVSKAVEFPRIVVRPNADTRIEVDPAYEYIRCTKSGERVLPLTISHGQGEARRELHAPTYDVHRLPSPGPDPFYLVVQACEKSEDGPLIKYEDAVFSYSDNNATVIAAEKATLDTRDFKLTGRIYYYSRGGEKTEQDHVVARLRGRAVELDSTERNASAAKRRR